MSHEEHESSSSEENQDKEPEKKEEPERLETISNNTSTTTSTTSNNNNNDNKEINNSFRRDLWEGTKKIYDRYDAGKKTLTDMISIFKLRAEGEEKFIKDSTLIANKTHSLREGGSCGTAWLDIRNSHKEIAKNHTFVLESVRKDIIAPLEQFKKEKQVIKERLNTEEKNLNNQLKSSKEKVESLREKYHSLSDQAEVALLTLKKARNDPNYDKKKMVKLEENNNRLSSESIKAHEQYKQTLSELNIFQRKYEEDMHKILENLQVIEEERLDFVKQILEKYLEINDKYIVTEREIHESITKGTLVMNRDQDLKNWIDSNKTGIESKEIAIEYVAYEQKYGGDVSAVKPKTSILSKFGFGKKKKPTPSKETSDKPKPTPSGPTNVIKLTEPKPKPETTTKETKETKPETKPETTENTDVEVVDVKKAKALFDFAKTEDNELSFKIGDILNITRVDDSGWWEGELNGEIGLVPGNYLQLLGDVEDDHSEEAPKKDEDSKKDEPKKEEPKKETPREEPKKEEPKKEEPKKETPREEPKKEEPKKEEPKKETPREEPKKEEPKKEEPKKETPREEPKKEEPKKEEPKKETPREEPKKEEPKKEEPKKEEPKKETPREEPKKEEPKKEEPKKEEPKEEPQEDSGEEDNTPIGKCVALYDFAGDEEDELSVKAGETIIIYSQVEGWCTGTNEAGEYGMIPGNYISAITPLDK